MHLTDEETEAQRPERACPKPSNFKHMCSVSGVRRGRGEERVGRAEAGRWEADLASPEQEMVGRGGHSLLGAGVVCDLLHDLAVTLVPHDLMVPAQLWEGGLGHRSHVHKNTVGS